MKPHQPQQQQKTMYGNFYPISKHMRQILQPVFTAKYRADKRAALKPGAEGTK